MSFKTKALECLENGNYEEYYNYSKKQYEETKDDESLVEFNKAKKKLELYKEIKDFMKKEKACYYEVLGLNSDASSKQIREAYTKLMSKFHPDRTKIKESNAVSRIIQKAYSVLSDHEKRREYNLKKNSLFHKRGENFSFTMSTNFDNGFYDYNRFARRAYFDNNIDLDEFDYEFGDAFMSDNRFFSAHFGSDVYNNLLRNLNRRMYRRRSNRILNRDPIYIRVIIFIMFLVIFLLFG
jgi:DnaJ-class molecular chaperone